MTKPELPTIKGCTDHGCIFGHPGGMGTNGGCACVRAIRGAEESIRFQRNIRALRDEVARLRGTDNRGKLWSLFRDLISQGTYIQMDYAAGKYSNYEEFSTRLDGAARERVEQFFNPPDSATVDDK
jgi:hypothetical protein